MVNIWQISPGQERDKFWPEFKSKNIIAMGWSLLGDLKKYSSNKEIELALRTKYPERYPEGKYPSNDIKSIKIFSQLVKQHDIIVAKKGATKNIYGIGSVTREYHFDNSREHYKNVLDVNWIIAFGDKTALDTSKRFIQPTAGKLEPELFKEIADSISSKFPHLKGVLNKMETENQTSLVIDKKIYNKIWPFYKQKNK